jgi:hypothetical protein
MAYTTITDSSAQFQTKIYTGNGYSSQAQTNTGNSNLQPDFAWIKKRAGGSDRSHQLYDSTRGATYLLHSDGTGEQQQQSAGLKAFSSNGFTVGDNDGAGANSATYVCWQWKATGGTTSSNTDGTITSTIQANTTAGFSIVSYSGNGVNGATVGHGLGSQPEIIFIKRTNVNASGGGSNWPVRSTLLTAQQVMYLDLDAAAGNSTTMFNNTYPSTTTFTIGDNEAVNAYQTNHSFTGTYIAYCFTSIKGFSSIGTYTGNNNADGPFVYTGFKPSWLMVKRTDSANHWLMFDIDRADVPFSNSIDQWLRADTNNAEASGIDFDFLSNGVKCRSSDPSMNASGGTYLYMAFADNPLVATNGVPATAR